MGFSKYDHALLKVELVEEIIDELKMVEKKNTEKIFSVYMRFIWDKHGHLGGKARKETDNGV